MVVIEKFEFTYKDYLSYCDSFYYPVTEEEYSSVEELGLEYTFDEEQEKNAGDKKHDKIFKDILQNKEKMAKFISTFVKYNVKPEQLEIYNSNYITKKFEYQNADIVYKIKGKEIYFLIEHQTKVDYSMAYRILNYCVEIIKSAIKMKEINRSKFRYPRVIPIVLYTGRQKWTASTSLAKIQTEDKNFEIKGIDAKYKLIDINQYEVLELLQERTMLANMMILEKCRSKEDIINNLAKILKNTQKGEARENLKRIVMYLYEDSPEESKKEIIKIIEESECEENMLNAKRIINESYRKERREGILEGIRQTIERMIKMNFKDEVIKQATGAKESDIEKVRQDMKQIASVQ